jgi:hypothetical protein
MLMPICTSAIVGKGNIKTNAESIVPRNNFFILLPPVNADEVWPPLSNLTEDGRYSRSDF